MKELSVTTLDDNIVYALVDDEDYEKLARYKWRVCKKWAYVNGGSGTLHSMIMGRKEGFEIDHIDRNKLNNQRSNRRFCTNRQNQANKKTKSSRTPYKGLHYITKTGRWQTLIRIDGVRHNLGIYDTDKEAALVYDIFAKQQYGEYALLNFPEIDTPTTNLSPRDYARRSRGAKSMYYGVKCSASKQKPWMSRITVNYKEINLGLFLTELEAAQAYDIAIINLKLDRPLNFP